MHDLCVFSRLIKFEPPTSPTDKTPHVLPDCVRHYGKHDRMNADHLLAWQDHQKVVVADLHLRLRHHMQVERAAASLAESRRVALEHAHSRVRRWLLQRRQRRTELRKALAGDVNETNLNLARSALRLRDRAMNAVRAIADLHGERLDGRCRCGTTIGRCAEHQPIRSELADAFRWENEQMRRMKDGLDHGLREDHPEAKKFIEHHPHDLWHDLPARADSSSSRGIARSEAATAAGLVRKKSAPTQSVAAISAFPREPRGLEPIARMRIGERSELSGLRCGGPRCMHDSKPRNQISTGLSHPKPSADACEFGLPLEVIRHGSAYIKPEIRPVVGQT